MRKEFDINKYELKAPSYSLIKRKNLFQIDEKIYDQKSRFYEEDGIWKSKEDKKEEISMLFAGDLLCQEDMVERYQTIDGGYDFKACFEYLKPLFQKADFVAGNLETPISPTAPYRGEILTHEGPFYCNAPIEYLEALRDAGFDMLTTANNHTLDAGARGIYETIQNLEKFRFIQTGTFCEETEKFVIVEIGGFKIGFTAFSLTYNTMQLNLKKAGKETLLNTFTEAAAKKIYDQMKEKGAEYTICFPHWGKEFTHELSKKQTEMADILSKIGYDLIVGAHSHVVQKFTYVNEKPVLYSLGNLMTHMNLSPSKMNTQYPILFHLKLERKEGRIYPHIDFIPCRILKDVDGIPFMVVPADELLLAGKEMEKNVKLVPAKVAKLLGCKKDVLNLSYPIAEKAADAVEENIKRYRDKLKQQKETVMPIPDAEEVPEKAFFFRKKLDEMKYRNCVQRNTGVFKKCLGYAELISYTSQAVVLNLADSVEDLPVTRVNNDRAGNNTARILYLGKNTNYIGVKAFKDFKKLESMRLFNSLKVIDKRAFEGCTNMTGIVLPKSLEKIGDYAFCNCKKMFSIKIPPNVKQIGKSAFQGCEKLTIYCRKDSYADTYAKKYGIPVKYMPL